MKVAALVLAAGGSTRLGRPKQLLLYAGQSLVRRTVTAALSAGCSPVLVVVGRDGETIKRALQGMEVRIVPNETWELGLSASIRAGIATLPATAEAVVLLVCDQPHVDATQVRALIEEQARKGKPMVASSYAGTMGVPALFLRSCFDKLLSLGGDAGAKELLLTAPEECATVPFAQGAIDIDTPEDL